MKVDITPEEAFKIRGFLMMHGDDTSRIEERLFHKIVPIAKKSVTLRNSAAKLKKRAGEDG